MKKCIIIANGKTPKKGLINYLKKQGYSDIICADGGANSARKLGIIPDYVIGDLDSITPENLRFFSEKTIVKRIKSQDDTDVEKCLKFAIKKNYKESILLGVIGDRLDHSFGNLGIARRYSDFIAIMIISEKSVLTIHSGDLKILTRPGEVISLYGFDEKTKVTSKGLKYRIKNEAIPFGKRESTSNEATSDEVELSIKNGKIFIIRDLSVLVKNNETMKIF